MLHLPAGFSISVLLRITTDGTPNSKDNLEARDNKTGPECKKQGCCRCEGKGVFSAGRKKKKQTMEAQMAGEGTLDC